MSAIDGSDGSDGSLDERALAAWSARCEAHVVTLAGDAAHDVEHVRRVVATAVALAAEERAPLAVVMPAAWLHDCVHVPKSSPDRAHASRRAADEARRLLAAWGYPAALHDAVAHAIEAHSYTARVTPRTPAARVVQDADRLDALGAVALARTLMPGGAVGRPLYAPADPFCARRTPDDGVATLDHLYTKLLGLAATMTTAAGRREGARRTAFLRRFLDELARELGVPSPPNGDRPATPG